tara:strand:- start:63 stop:500 length:438 start_codon:yes stop_codon:yes gene_type:complete
MEKEKKYPKRYTAGLSKKDKEKQKKQLDKSTSDYKKGKYTDRKKLESFKEKKSGFVKQVKEKLGVPMNFEKVADKLTRTKKREKELLKGFEEIYDKGKGAYYSSGSRPNQTPESWGKARVASVLVGGKSRNIDKKIVDKYKIPKI